MVELAKKLEKTFEAPSDTLPIFHVRTLLLLFAVAVLSGLAILAIGIRTPARALSGDADAEGQTVLMRPWAPSTAPTLAAEQAVTASAATSASTYLYSQISLRDAYGYYIAASFTVAGGLGLYALSYVPSRDQRRTRFAVSFQTWVSQPINQ